MARHYRAMWTGEISYPNRQWHEILVLLLNGDFLPKHPLLANYYIVYYAEFLPKEMGA